MQCCLPQVQACESPADVSISQIGHTDFQKQHDKAADAASADLAGSMGFMAVAFGIILLTILSIGIIIALDRK